MEKLWYYGINNGTVLWKNYVTCTMEKLWYFTKKLWNFDLLRKKYGTMEKKYGTIVNYS